MPYIRRMQGVRQLILTACVIGSAISGFAEAPVADSYKSIVDRNPFGLKDPPPPPPPKDPNPPPAVKKEDFYLTGISTIGNPKKPKAYLLAKDQSKKDYDQKFYSLAVGDKQGEVTLMEIDTKGRRVKITYLGEEKWLSMKDNGVPTPAGPPVALGGPGQAMPIHNNGVPPQPGAIPLPLPNINPNPNSNLNPGLNQQGSPVNYPNAANMTRRPVRTTAGGRQYTNPQNDAESIKQIIEAQNPQNGQPVTLPANPNPTFQPPPPPPFPLPGM